MFHLILLVIITGVNCNSECDCNTITALQEFIQKEFFNLKFENSRITSRLRRLEASSRHSSMTNLHQTVPASDQNEVQTVSNEKATNNSKRIDTIESTLARVMTLLDLNVPNTADKVQDDEPKNRIYSFEAELASVSNKLEKILDVNNLSKSMVIKLDSSLKKTLRAEKTNRVKFEIDIQEKINSFNDYSRNFTEETENLIDQFKNEVLQNNEKFKEEMNIESIETNQTVYRHINDTESSHSNLQKEITDTQIKLSRLENATVKDKTDGGWSNWGSFGTCSDSCGGGVKVRSRTCTYPKPSLKGQYCEGSTVQVAICNKNTCPEYRVSFTAYDIQQTKGAYVNAIFSKIYQSYGEGYNRYTGKFTCKVPGIYMFSFQISKIWDIETDRVLCSLYRNNARIIGAKADPHGDDKDGYSISLTGTFHLNKNDVVYVGHCIGLAFTNNNIYSSFTGVLLTPDYG